MNATPESPIDAASADTLPPPYQPPTEWPKEQPTGDELETLCLVAAATRADDLKALMVAALHGGAAQSAEQAWDIATSLADRLSGVRPEGIAIRTLCGGPVG